MFKLWPERLAPFLFTYYASSILYIILIMLSWKSLFTLTQRCTYLWIFLAAVYPNPAYTTPAVPVLPADYDANNTTVSLTFLIVFVFLRTFFLGFVSNVLLLLFIWLCLMQIFVGNLDPNVTEEELKQSFMQFGEIPYVKIPVGKGCGFVQFGTRFV